MCYAVHFVVLRSRSHWQVENLANVKSVCLRSGQGWGTFGLAVKLCVGMLAPRVSAWGYVLTWPPAGVPRDWQQLGQVVGSWPLRWISSSLGLGVRDPHVHLGNDPVDGRSLPLPLNR